MRPMLAVRISTLSTSTTDEATDSELNPSRQREGGGAMTTPRSHCSAESRISFNTNGFLHSLQLPENWQAGW